MSTLCKICSPITPALLSQREDLGAGDIQYGYKHYPSFHELEVSALSCALCAMILATMEQKGQIVAPDEDVINDPSTIRLVGFPLPTVDSTGTATPAKLSSILVGNAFIRGWLSIYASEQDEAVKGIDGRLIGPSAESKQTIDLVRNWIGECKHHHLCSALISGKTMIDNEPIMPTYVVDVGVAGQAPKLLKIREGISAPYAALSHVWGSGQYTVQTMTSNVLQMQHSIELTSRESKSLSDAVAITRALGYAYLWIDSLCIVQDGPGFDDECARMGQIYENAEVVIAATGAANDHIGCIIPRTKPKLAPVQFTTKFLNGTASHFFVNLQLGRLANDVDEGIWASRAWLLQERVLSRRTIHFAREQVYWECATMTRSEDGAVIKKGNPKRLFYGTLDNFSQDSALSAIPDPKGNDAMLCYQRFCLLVAEYTTRLLSRPEDVLDALSGVVTEITNRTGGTYLAGHWQDYLQIGLVWQAKKARLEIPDSPRAPSWSWASRTGPIFHDPYLFKAIADDSYTVGPNNLTVQNEDVHGKTVSGSLKLSGKMRPVTKMEGGINDELWAKVSTSFHEYEQDRGLLSGLTQDDGTVVGWGSFDAVDQSHVDTDTREVIALCVSKNLPPALPPADTSTPATAASPVDSAPTPNPPVTATSTPASTATFNVLLLQPTDNTSTAYQRVGMGEITADLWFDDIEVTTSITLT